MSNIEEHIVGLPESWKILARAIDEYIKSYDQNYTIDQVKDKFGGMRYYFSFSDNESEDRLIGYAQSGIQNQVQKFSDLSFYMNED